MRVYSLACVSAVAGSLCLSASGADWPQWRGPDRNGISQETGLLKEWPKDGPHLLWQRSDVGYGYSTPSVVEERIYLQSNTGLDSEFVQALDVKDGKKIWETRLGKVGFNNYPGSRSTPTVEGNVVYALGSDGNLACLDTGSGKIRWAKNLPQELGGKPGFWAYAESPLLDGDALICTPGGKEATMVALRKQTGELIWKLRCTGGRQRGLRLRDGGERRRCQAVRSARFRRSDWRRGKDRQVALALRPDRQRKYGQYPYARGPRGQDLLRQSREWRACPIEDCQRYDDRRAGLLRRQAAQGHRRRIERDGFLYGTIAKAFVCTEFATGKEKWRDPSVGAGAVCFANGCVYIHGESGSVALIEATPEGYREHGRFKPTNLPERKFGAWKRLGPIPSSRTADFISATSTCCGATT